MLGGLTSSSDAYWKQAAAIFGKVAAPSEALKAANHAASLFTAQHKSVVAEVAGQIRAFGVPDGIGAGFQTIQSELLSSIAAITASYTARFETIVPAIIEAMWAEFPANLRSVARRKGYRWLTQVLLIDGIALFRVPSPEAVQSLSSAETPKDRRVWLRANKKVIIRDCALLLEQHQGDVHSEIVEFLEEGIRLLRKGHHTASQALFSSVVTTIVEQLDEVHERLVKSAESVQKRAAQLDEFDLQDWLALQPLLAAYTPFWPRRGDPIPEHYSRHASVHFASKQQFTTTNAVQALLCATSLAAYVFGWPDVVWPINTIATGEAGSTSHD